MTCAPGSRLGQSRIPGLENWPGIAKLLNGAYDVTVLMRRKSTIIQLVKMYTQRLQN